MRHFLDIDRVDAADLDGVISDACAAKAARQGRPKGAPDAALRLKDRMVALVFEKPSTRTRTSFDAGVRQMGGQTMVLTGGELQLGQGESIADTARVLSRYVDLIMLRTFDESTLIEMAEHATVPVVNGLTNRTHPCQVMADVMTWRERRGSVAGRKAVWCGDGNNVCASFLHAAGRFGFDLTFAGPRELAPEERIVDWARGEGAEIVIEPDPDRAVAGADLVVTDAWMSMHDSDSARASRHAMLEPYQVNAALMARADSEALFMHCLPAHRGEEVTDEVMDGAQSVVFDEAENRLHIQKAIMQWCMQG